MLTSPPGDVLILVGSNQLVNKNVGTNQPVVDNLRKSNNILFRT